MQVSLSSGKYKILNSGHAFLFEQSEDLTLDIVADNGFSFKMVLKFINNPTSDRSIKYELSGDTITFSCTNFNEQGTGLTSPVQVGTIAGKELYIIFWTYLDGQEINKVRSVRYTLFCES